MTTKTNFRSEFNDMVFFLKAEIVSQLKESLFFTKKMDLKSFISDSHLSEDMDTTFKFSITKSGIKLRTYTLFHNLFDMSEYLQKTNDPSVIEEQNTFNTLTEAMDRLILDITNTFGFVIDKVDSPQVEIIKMETNEILDEGVNYDDTVKVKQEVYDALYKSRNYKSKFSIEEATKIIKSVFEQTVYKDRKWTALMMEDGVLVPIEQTEEFDKVLRKVWKGELKLKEDTEKDTEITEKIQKDMNIEPTHKPIDDMVTDNNPLEQERKLKIHRMKQIHQRYNVLMDTLISNVDSHNEAFAHYTVLTNDKPMRVNLELYRDITKLYTNYYVLYITNPFTKNKDKRIEYIEGDEKVIRETIGEKLYALDERYKGIPIPKEDSLGQLEPIYKKIYDPIDSETFTQRMKEAKDKALSDYLAERK